MANKNRRESLSFVATLIGLIVDSREIILWLMPVVLALITGVTLVNQPTPPTVPGSNLRLGPWYQFTLLLSGALVYLNFLRRRWKTDKIEDDPLSESFSGFLVMDLLGLKRPYLLIPLPFFILLWAEIIFSAPSEYSGSAMSLFFLLGFFVIALFLGFTLSASKPTINMDEWESDSALKERWLKRIGYYLEQSGYVTTMSFANSVGLNVGKEKDNEQINWAIKMYFREFEFEQNLTLSEEYYVDIGNEEDGVRTFANCYELSMKSRQEN